MANYNLTSQQIKDTYEQLTQISGSVLVDGTGSAVNSLEVSASYATSALTASYALNAEGVSVDTGSLLVTASAALNVITFTKGDNSTFNVTVDTGSGAGGGGLNPSEFYTYTASNDARVDSLTAATSSYLTSADISDKLDTSVFNAYTSSNDSTVAGKLDTSVYTSNSSSVASRLTTNEGNISTNTSDISTNSSNISTLTSQTSSYAKTNVDNVFTGTQTFNNIAVNGTGSFAYIESVTGSAKIIGDAFIILNADSPTERYAGIKVYDSGSSPISTGSFQWDSVNNDWFYEYDKDATDYAVALFGPEFTTKGTPTYPTTNSIQKGTGGHHLGDSLLSDDGSTVSMTGEFDVTGAVSSSVGFKGNLDGNASTSTTASFALTASYVEGGAEAGLVSGTGTDSMKSADSLTTTAAQANGQDSIGLGNNAIANSDYTISIGRDSNASGTRDSVAIGRGAYADTQATAIGPRSSAGSSYAVSIGESSNASGTYGVAIGRRTVANSLGTVSLGYDGEAQASYATAIGYQAFAQDTDTISIGRSATVSVGASDGIAIGSTSQVTGTYAVAVGSGADALASHAVSIGSGATASGLNSIAIGKNTSMTASNGISIGGEADGIFKYDGSSKITLNSNVEVTGQLYTPTFAGTIASSTSSIDFDNGNFATLNCSSATYINNPSNLKSGTTYTVIITNGANISGYGTVWKFAGGTQPTLSANTDVLTCVSDGTNLYATALADFS